MKSNQQQQIRIKSPSDFLSNMLRWLPSLLFQYLVAQEYICATRNIPVEQNYDRQSDLTSYYKPDKKYHPSSAHQSSLQNMEKTETSNHVLNANKLGLLRTKGKYPTNSLFSLCSVPHALHTPICCYRTETEENHRPRRRNGTWGEASRRSEEPARG